MLDKLRRVFSQMSDSSCLRILSKLDRFLKEVSELPAVVLEGPSVGYTEHSAQTCFPLQKKCKVCFYTAMADPPPPPPPRDLCD